MNDYLSIDGKRILNEIEKHISENLQSLTIDYLELGMLANSFALYRECAKVCNEDGIKMTFINDKGGVYEQIRPEYTVMKAEYANILKHSVKFGLNPGDRDKLFSKLKAEKPKKKGFDLGGDMKIAK